MMTQSGFLKKCRTMAWHRRLPHGTTAQRFCRVLGMLSSSEVKVLYPT
jgi:hypothetical protein